MLRTGQEMKRSLARNDRQELEGCHNSRWLGVTDAANGDTDPDFSTILLTNHTFFPLPVSAGISYSFGTGVDYFFPSCHKMYFYNHMCLYSCMFMSGQCNYRLCERGLTKDDVNTFLKVKANLLS